MQITWKINTLERVRATGAVTSAHWTCIGTDQGVTEASYGQIYFEVDPTSPGFVQYNDLTEAQVLQWTKDRMQLLSQQDRTMNSPEDIERTVAQKINLKLNPEKAQGVPWR